MAEAAHSLNQRASILVGRGRIGRRAKREAKRERGEKREKRAEIEKRDDGEKRGKRGLRRNAGIF